MGYSPLLPPEELCWEGLQGALEEAQPGCWLLPRLRGKDGEMKSGMTRVTEEGAALQEGKANTGFPGSHSFCSSPATVWDWGTLAFRAQLGSE